MARIDVSDDDSRWYVLALPPDCLDTAARIYALLRPGTQLSLSQTNVVACWMYARKPMPLCSRCKGRGYVKMSDAAAAKLGLRPGLDRIDICGKCEHGREKVPTRRVVCP